MSRNQHKRTDIVVSDHDSSVIRRDLLNICKKMLICGGPMQGLCHIILGPLTLRIRPNTGY
jgi:hypothetical protein